MRVLLNRWFARFARRKRLDETAMCEAVQRADRGLIDADLGGGVIKQRVARRGQGRSGGYRVLIALRRPQIAVFMIGFAKNERANIEDDELNAMREAARDVLRLSEDQIDRLIEQGAFTEIDCGGQDS